MITPEIFHKIKIIVIGFLFSAILLIAISVIQKIIVGHTPLLHKECIILVLFGGVSGSLIAHYLFKIKTLNKTLQQRVNSLESVLPICSYCKKIRKSKCQFFILGGSGPLLAPIDSPLFKTVFFNTS